MNLDCIFCKIVKGDASSYKIWEDEDFLAFLSIFQNTEGVTVVIPKEHHTSYLFDLSEDVMIGLVKAAKRVAQQIDARFEDVGRTGMVAEGFGVDHVHLKLFPLHGTATENWKPIKSDINTYFEKYPGYISSHDADMSDPESLRKITEKLRKK